MVQIKALQILAALNKDEFTKLGQFISSPYFTRSKDLIRLFNSLKIYYPEFDASKLKFEKIYKKIYPGKSFNEGTIRNLFSDLGVLAEKYLAYINYESTFFFRINSLAELNDRRLDKIFEKNYEKFSEENETFTGKFDFKNLNSFLLNNERKIYNIRRNREPDENIVNSGADSLLTFFLSMFMELMMESATMKRDYNITAKNKTVDNFFDIVNMNAVLSEMKNRKSPLVNELEFNYYILLLQLSPEGFRLYFSRTLELFRLYIPQLLPNRKYNTYVSLVNILNINTRADDVHLKKIAFEIKKEMVETGITSELNGKLKTVEFTNFMDSALMVGEIKWAKDFLESKIASVDENIKNDLYSFYKAGILFYEKDYIGSNEYLSKVVKDSAYFRIDCKILRLKNFYELNYFEAAFSQAEAFKQFLIRNSTLSQMRRISFTNFLKFYSALLKKKSGMNNKKDSLADEIKECQKLRSKVWLLEKISELEKIKA